jgi:hypothetical protein
MIRLVRYDWLSDSSPTRMNLLDQQIVLPGKPR